MFAKLLISLGTTLITFSAFATGPFFFNPETETCIDSSGNQGLNPLVPEEVFLGFEKPGQGEVIAGRNVQCTDFSGVEFSNYIGWSYAVLKDWDFRGSDFTGTGVSFNFITGGLFQGAKIDGLSVAYGRLTAADTDLDLGRMDPPEQH